MKRAILSMVLILAHLLALGQEAWAEMPNIELPEIGDPTAVIMSAQQEQELGAAFFRNLHGQMQINTDPEINDYIQSLGDRLTINSDTPGQTYTFFVVNENVINPFPGPRGYIGVHSARPF